MGDEPHARKDGTKPVLSDDFTAASVEELLRAVSVHLKAAGVNKELTERLLKEQFEAAPALDGEYNEPRLNRNSIPTEMQVDDADLLLSALKRLEGAADALGLGADLNAVSRAGEREVHGGGPTGSQARLMQRELGGSETNLRRKADLPASTVRDPMAPDVLIIGGAAAGLSAAACLLHHGVENILVLEKGARSGDNWKRRYDRLHLHDIIDECHLPYMAMPDNFPTFPTRVQYAPRACACLCARPCAAAAAGSLSLHICSRRTLLVSMSRITHSEPRLCGVRTDLAIISTATKSRWAFPCARIPL